MYLNGLDLWGLYDGGLCCLDDPVDLDCLSVGQLDQRNGGTRGSNLAGCDGRLQGRLIIIITIIIIISTSQACEVIVTLFPGIIHT